MSKLIKKSVAVLLCVILTLGVFGIAASADSHDGSFNILVQNVAGLPIPEGFSPEEGAGDPLEDAIQMGRRLGYLGLTQEERDDVNARIAHIDEKVAAFNSDIAAVNAQIADVKILQSELLARIDSLNAQKEATDDDDAIAQLDAQIAALNAEFTANAEKIAVLDAHIASDEAKISALSAKKSSLQDELYDDDYYADLSYPLHVDFLTVQEDFNYDQFFRQEMGYYADTHAITCEKCGETAEFTQNDLSSKDSVYCSAASCGKRVFFADSDLREVSMACPECGAVNYFADSRALNENGEFCEACGSLMPVTDSSVQDLADPVVICPYCDAVTVVTDADTIEANSLICPHCGDEIEDAEADYVDSLLYRHGTEHSGGVPMGDGLNTFSGTYNLYDTSRVTWKEAYGIMTGLNDELTNKGFSVTTVEIAEGYYLDIYNLHADAGGLEGDVAARAAQFDQLADYIMTHSLFDPETGVYDHAVLIGGDFNTYISAEDTGGNSKLIQNLIEKAHLNDAWAVRDRDEIAENVNNTEYDYAPYYEYARRDAVPAGITDEYMYRSGFYDSVERILYASGNGLEITLDSFGYGRIYSEDDETRMLSDHPYAYAMFNYDFVEKVNRKTFTNDDGPSTDQPRGFLFKFLEFIRNIFRAIGLLFKDHNNININI